jgi:hypothetical protein
MNKEKNKNKKTTAFLSRGTLIELYNMCVDICHRIPNDLISSLNQTGFFDFLILAFIWFLDLEVEYSK